MAQMVKNLPASAGDIDSIPVSRTSPGGGHVNSLHYSCLGNPMDRGAWWATVHGVAKSQTWMSDQHFLSVLRRILSQASWNDNIFDNSAAVEVQKAFKADVCHHKQGNLVHICSFQVCITMCDHSSECLGKVGWHLPISYLFYLFPKSSVSWPCAQHRAR